MNDQKSTPKDTFKQRLTKLSEVQIDAMWDIPNGGVSYRRIAGIEAENAEHDQCPAEKRAALVARAKTKDKGSAETRVRVEGMVGATIYSSPHDETLVWIGSGCRPKWLNRLLKNGTTLNDLEDQEETDVDRAGLPAGSLISADAVLLWAPMLPKLNRGLCRKSDLLRDV